jgi:hypothetical protein
MRAERADQSPGETVPDEESRQIMSGQTSDGEDKVGYRLEKPKLEKYRIERLTSMGERIPVGKAALEDAVGEEVVDGIEPEEVVAADAGLAEEEGGSRRVEKKPGRGAPRERLGRDAGAGREARRRLTSLSVRSSPAPAARW